MFSYEDTLARLRTIAASKGLGYRYVTDPRAIQLAQKNGDDIEFDDDGNPIATGCYYRYEDGTPACLVGQLLYDIDPEFVPMEEGIRDALLPDHIQFEDDAMALLKQAQGNQDSGQTWVNSVENAELYLRDAHKQTLEKRGN